MTLKTYLGSCHCGAIRFEADVDLGRGTVKCNCSSCAKARAWLVFASPDCFRLIAGADSQGLYQWTPPGRAAPTLHYHFCKNCGIRTPSHGVAEALGGKFHAIQVTLLDDVDPDELASAPIQFVDGRNNHFDQAPADTRLL
ncbi:MAG TPA: GFA family protein [Roseiarcus sp.]